MNDALQHPLFYHRSRRDHHLRILFSCAQRQLESRNRQHARGDRQEIRHALSEALFHAKETIRERTLEWPSTSCNLSDKELAAYLDELDSWFELQDNICSGGEDIRSRLRELIEVRLRHGLTLFHTRPRPQSASY